MTRFWVEMTGYSFQCSIFNFQFIAPSVHWGEPAFFVRNGEMARGVEIDKRFCDMGIKNFIFWDFCFYPPAFFVPNGEMAKDLATN